jgi:serine/threonine-protein kinase
MIVWLAGSQRTPAQTDNADVAVLPFSSGAAEADLAARLTESVTAELARLGTVSVVSHTSALQFAGRPQPLREIAGALNADFIVEASVEHDGSGLLVVTRLVDAETDRKVWVSDYRGALDNTRVIAQRLAFDVSTEVTKRQSR